MLTAGALALSSNESCPSHAGTVHATPHAAALSAAAEALRRAAQAWENIFNDPDTAPDFAYFTPALNTGPVPAPFGYCACQPQGP